MNCCMIDEPVYCTGCKTARLRVRIQRARFKKVQSFVNSFSHLRRPQEQLDPPARVITAHTVPPKCNSRRLDLQFQLYYFAQEHELIDLQNLVLQKVFYTLMHLQLDRHTTAGTVKSLLSPLTKLPTDNKLWTLLVTYWACVREDIGLTTLKFEEMANQATGGELRLDEREADLLKKWS